MLMNRAGDHVFTDSTFAAQQDSGARGCDPLDSRKNFAHGGAAAQKIVELIAIAELSFQLEIFIAQRPQLDRLIDDSHEMIERKRLGKKVDGAGFHGLDRGFNAAESCHDDDGRKRVLQPEIGQQLQSGFAWQPQIGDY